MSFEYVVNTKKVLRRHHADAKFTTKGHGPREGRRGATRSRPPVRFSSGGATMPTHPPILPRREVTRCGSPSFRRRRRANQTMILHSTNPRSSDEVILRARRRSTTTPRARTAATARRRRPRQTPKRSGPSPRSHHTGTRAWKPWTTSPCTTWPATASWALSSTAPLM